MKVVVMLREVGGGSELVKASCSSDDPSSDAEEASCNDDDEPSR